jgi:hypothetical protein
MWLYAEGFIQGIYSEDMNRKLTFWKVIGILFFWPYLLLWWLGKRLIHNHKISKEVPSLAPEKRVDDTSQGVGDEDKNRSITTTGKTNELVESLRIPEPTRSMLFTTDEDTSKIQDALGISVTINLDPNTGNSSVSTEEKSFFSEPSLIWTKLSIKPNNWLEDKAMYWPSYSAFDPEHRYQYLRWLRDIEKPTNLSYVFLYFYGLERHMLIGNYDGAVDEILRLIKSHTKPSFRSYATTSLITASIIRGRLDIIERAPFLLEEEVDEALALRIKVGTSMTAEDVISIASKVGFTNKRYIKLHPKMFNRNLTKVISDFEKKHGNILSIFNLDEFKKEDAQVFANMSIPEKYRTAKIPVILDNKRFKSAMFGALSEAHRRTKIELHPINKK